MSLKDEINNTNTQKENIKTVANNIDNKLVELGGEQATDLSDVPNKMKNMLGLYKKIAILNINKSLEHIPYDNNPNYTKACTIDVDLNNVELDFTKNIKVYAALKISTSPAGSSATNNLNACVSNYPQKQIFMFGVNSITKLENKKLNITVNNVNPKYQRLSVTLKDLYLIEGE